MRRIMRRRYEEGGVRRQEWPRALAWPADACAEPYRRATWHCQRTPGCPLGYVRAGHRPLSTGVVDRRWKQQTRSATRCAENGSAPSQVSFPGCFHCMPSVSTYPCLALSRGPCCFLVLPGKPVSRHKPKAWMRACPAPACACHWCAHALHLLVFALHVPARVLCLVFRRHAPLQ